MYFSRFGESGFGESGLNRTTVQPVMINKPVCSSRVWWVVWVLTKTTHVVITDSRTRDISNTLADMTTLTQTVMGQVNRLQRVRKLLWRLCNTAGDVHETTHTPCHSPHASHLNHLLLVHLPTRASSSRWLDTVTRRRHRLANDRMIVPWQLMLGYGTGRSLMSHERRA